MKKKHTINMWAYKKQNNYMSYETRTTMQSETLGEHVLVTLEN